MKKPNLLKFLYVGIDVSLQENKVCIIGFEENVLFRGSILNNLTESEGLINKLLRICSENVFEGISIVIESTSIYAYHLVNLLSSNASLKSINTSVYYVNPSLTANFKKGYRLAFPKTDINDAIMLAAYARFCISKKVSPWFGEKYLALQRLTRLRYHYSHLISREKQYALTNIYLKFSELLAVGKKDDEAPFSNHFGTTSSAILSEFLSVDEITQTPLEDLVDFIIRCSKNHIVDPKKTAEQLQILANNSFHLQEDSNIAVTYAIQSSMRIIKAYENEIKHIEKDIAKIAQKINNSAYQSLLSVTGIGPTIAAGIIAEIGSISVFKTDAKLAKYAGIFWTIYQSGKFTAEDKNISKSGNVFLRYYIIEAANSIKKYDDEYREFYNKKFAESSSHKHKRALVLTARKLVRMIFSLLDKNQVFTSAVERKSN